MVGWVTENLFRSLLIAGPPVLFLIFVLKGALVGKILPTSVFLPGYIVAISPNNRGLVAVLLVTTIGYFLGQMIIYYFSRRYGYQFAELVPGKSISSGEIERSTAVFEKYGGRGIFITNCVPFLGGLLFIPAGVTRYPVVKTTLFGYTSTVLYQATIVLVALGAFRVVGGHLYTLLEYVGW